MPFAKTVILTYLVYSKIVMRNFVFYLLLFINADIQAQPAKLSFDHLMVENGMPENYAIDICQDNKGYIWCGTQRGLMRYDGYNIKVYRQEISGNTNINDIGSVFVDKNGVVWAGTIGNYLLRYNASSDSFTIYKPDTVKAGTFSYITNIFEDGENSLWLKISNPANPLYQLERFDKNIAKFFIKLRNKIRMLIDQYSELSFTLYQFLISVIEL